jgi:hypothetical protein
MQEVADDETGMYDPGHCAYQDTQRTRRASNTQKQSDNNCATEDLSLETVPGVAVIVNVLEQSPDDACTEEREW